LFGLPTVAQSNVTSVAWAVGVKQIASVSVAARNAKVVVVFMRSSFQRGNGLSPKRLMGDTARVSNSKSTSGYCSKKKKKKKNSPGFLDLRRKRLTKIASNLTKNSPKPSIPQKSTHQSWRGDKKEKQPFSGPRL